MNNKYYKYNSWAIDVCISTAENQGMGCVCVGGGNVHVYVQ